jgi:hypothetical protein
VGKTRQAGESKKTFARPAGLRGKQLAKTPKAKIDYFATSLPTMLLFDDDLQFRQETTALFLQAQAQLGSGQKSEGEKPFEKSFEARPEPRARGGFVGGNFQSKQNMITAPQRNPQTSRPNYNLGYIWLISVVAALGGLLFGWDWVVIGGAKPFFERYFHIANNAQSAGRTVARSSAVSSARWWRAR